MLEKKGSHLARVCTVLLSALSLHTPGMDTATSSTSTSPLCLDHNKEGYRYSWCERLSMQQYHSSVPVKIGDFSGRSVIETPQTKVSTKLNKAVLSSKQGQKDVRAFIRLHFTHKLEGTKVYPDMVLRAGLMGVIKIETQKFTAGDACDNRQREGEMTIVHFSYPILLNAGFTPRFSPSRGVSEFISISEKTPCEYEGLVLIIDPIVISDEGYNQYVEELEATTEKCTEVTEAAETNETSSSTPLLDKDNTAIGSQDVKDMFEHGMGGYMKHAHPAPDLKPLTCEGSGFGFVDVPSLTLIDSLDTYIVMKDLAGFQAGVRLVIESFPEKFDIDTTVSLFETTIRVLGGLLSAHIFAEYGTELVDWLPEHAKRSAFVPGYNGELLGLAEDLGTRLSPAFRTTSGIPYGAVNLRRGVPRGETTVASLAGAGSLSIEFTVLSILTNDTRFMTLGNEAALQLFKRRSANGLMGKHLNFLTQEWTEYGSGIGTNSDSFYEYLLKNHILNPTLDANWQAYDEVYEAVMAYVADGDFYADVHMGSGLIQRQEIEGLAAFWPGLQVLTGDFEHASRTLNAFFHIVDRVGFLPEGFFYNDAKGFSSVSSATDKSYLLRPELIESVMYFMHATGDDSWLIPIRKLIKALEEQCKTECGYASLEGLKAVPRRPRADVLRAVLQGAGADERDTPDTGIQTDSMQSFFLSETLKYLYIILEDAESRAEGGPGHWLLGGKEQWVFSTEAHMFPIKKLQGLMSADFIAASKELSEEFSWEFASRPLSIPMCPAEQLWVRSYDPDYEPTLGLGLNNAQDITTTQLSGASLQEFLKSLGGSDDAAKLLKQYSWK